jgi:hypothetical protein
LREFGENFSFPTQNFTSVSAGRNRCYLEKLGKAILRRFFDRMLILPLQVRHI